MHDNSLTALGAYQKTRRQVIGALLLLLLALLVFGQSLSPPETAIHEIVEMAGIVLIVLGIFGRLWCTLYIGGRKSSEIVDTGPYSITRNPLYLFSTVAAAGVGAQMGSIVATFGFAVLCALTFHVVIRREEQYLSATFGVAFDAYLARVPRFFPKPSLYREGERTPFEPARLKRTLFDGLLFLVAIPFFEAIDAAQQSGMLPVLYRLP
jgi:protein-S-isoprenylcysteine O-methyltransferase Ste14